MSGLSNIEIRKVVNRYIGIDKGYLGDFSYRTHADFYPDYCALNIDPNKYEGTTRERFEKILSTVDTRTQTKIIRGVIERFPVEAKNSPPTRTSELKQELLELASKLERSQIISSPNLRISNETIEAALQDAETLIDASGATNAIDRIHTGLQGYLREICNRKKISYSANDNIAKLFRLVIKNCSQSSDELVFSDEIQRIIMCFGSVLDSMQTLRNDRSLAHSNENLLESAESKLYINAARTIFQYLNEKMVEKEERVDS